MTLLCTCRTGPHIYLTPSVTVCYDIDIDVGPFY